MHSLIFDLYISGHHSEYINYLASYLSKQGANGNTYTFVVHPDFTVQFPEIVAKNLNNHNVSFHCITSKENIDAKSGSLLKQSFAQFKLLTTYAKHTSADRVILLHLNILQPALIIKRSEFLIKGILFSQFTRQDKLLGLKEKLRYYRRYIQTFILTKNKNIISIFLLNDLDSCLFLNNQMQTDIFKYLPDPIPELTISEFLDVREIFDISINNKIVLHFGVLGSRKGTLDILNSLFELQSHEQKGLTLVLAGKVESDATLIAINNLIQQLKESCNYVQLIFIQEFVSNNLKNNLFKQCDVVLVPYRNVEASSGVFSHAVAANKPVAGYSSGLLGELISNYNRGIIIKTINLKEIVSQDFSEIVIEVGKSSIDVFSDKILNQ